jgi:Na+:H+ antiporter, NhaA family
MTGISKNRLSLQKDFRNFFNTFIMNEAFGGVLLLICAIASLIFANVPYFSNIHSVWDSNAGIHVGNFSLDMTLQAWTNDALMAVFFFVVGLEIKREILVGELSSFKHAILPIFAALGGMIVPACIYAFFNHGTPESSNGWGIPMATDIAFAIGIISLVGKRAPIGLKVFLTALAIVDDLGAIVVLAVFYPAHTLHFDMLLYACGVVLVLLILNRYKVNYILLYVLLGLVLWYLVYMSGIHSTIAGVVLAMTIPSKTAINEVRFYVRVKHLLSKFKKVSSSELEVLANSEQQEIISMMHREVSKINPMMHRFESALHPWVTYMIMPLFALANAGVVFDSGISLWPPQPVMEGIFFGLLLGKPIGIFLFSWLSVKLKFAELPSKTRWSQVFALGIVAGIGFTMSIFIDGMAFDSESITNLGKATILATSFAAAIVGLFAILLTSKKYNSK